MKTFYTILFSCLFVAASVTLKAEDTMESALTRIENQHLEQVLAQEMNLQFILGREYMINSFLANQRKMFHQQDMMAICSAFEKMNDSQLMAVTGAAYRDPTVSLILSVLVGYLGIDRFYVGDTVYGVLKLITAGGFGIWWLVDMFLIQDRTKEVNFNEFNEIYQTSTMFLPQ